MNICYERLNFMKCVRNINLLEIVSSKFLTTKQIADGTKLSFNTIKKCLNGNVVTMGVAKKLCEYFDCEFKDIFSIAKD